MPADGVAESACPSADELACFIDGALPPSAVAALEVHLAHCDRCCSIVAAVPDDEEAHDLDGEPTEVPDAAIGGMGASRLGRYVLLERVGAGGMGVVWAAYDPELDRRVAIKLLHYDGSGSRGIQARRRLVHEARAMARVAHPNIVAVHDVVEVDERVFMIMELVAGRTLGAWLREVPRGWREIVEVFVAAGRGLVAAHDQGVVHRDFKPDNVLVGDDGRVRVGDFGLASTDSGASAEVMAAFDGDPADAAAARTAGFVGTPAYMAPEQFAAEPIDARTDQFAFCIALWESLYGKRPFSGTSVTALAAAVLEGDVARAPERRRVPARIERALRRGLARDPAERHPDLRTLIVELERAVARRRAWIGIAAAGLGAIGLASVVAWPQEDACATAPAWLEGGWTAARRDALRATAETRGEAAVDLAVRVTEAADARVAAMEETFAASCRAAFIEHTERAEDHDLRLVCLRRTAAAVDVVTGFAVEADPLGLARALRSMDALASNAACDDVEAVEADVPWMGSTVDRERAIALSIAVDKATVLRNLGDLAAARELLEDPLAHLDEPGLGRIAAATLYEQAQLKQRAGGGDEDLRRALAVGLESNNVRVVFNVLVALVFEAGVRRNDLRGAEAYADVATAYVGASQLGAEARGSVLIALAQSRERAGDPEGARKALAEASALFLSVGTHTTMHRFPMYILLGLLEESEGKLGAAEEQYEHVRRSIERVMGPFNPDVAVALEYSAIVRRKRGAYDLALEAGQRALEIRRALLGPRHVEVGASLAGIASILTELGRYGEAEAAHAEALAIWHGTGGMERNAALTIRGLADIARRSGELDEALGLYRESLEISQRALGSSHPELATGLLGLAECERVRGSPAAALPLLERAHTLVAGDSVDPLERAKVGLALARVLLESGSDIARARELAEQARTHAAGVPEFAESRRVIADADALLAASAG